MESNKPREFWVDLATEWFHDKLPADLSKPPHCHETVHVIEKSAYDQLEAKLAIAVEALEHLDREMNNKQTLEPEGPNHDLIREALEKIEGKK